MWNYGLGFRPNNFSFFTNAPFADAFADPSQAPNFGVPFFGDMYSSGDSSIPMAQMLPWMMSVIMQQQLAMMFLAELLANGGGNTCNQCGRSNGRFPSRSWGGGNRLPRGAWTPGGAPTGNPTGNPSGGNPSVQNPPSGQPVSPPAGGPATASEISRIPNYHQLAPRLQQAAVDAVRMGLRVTSTTGGRHTATSNHYTHNHADGLGHAIDVAGSHEQMAAFYRRYAGSSPRELYYDPLGGIKRGNQIGAIGGHGDHVHLAL